MTKRVNPKTGKPFKAREEENGKYFKHYDKSRKNYKGYFVEKWYGAIGKENLVKRINPKTGKPFKQGDINENGRIFKCYEFVGSKVGGYAKENWLTKETWIKDKIRRVIVETRKVRGHTKNKRRRDKNHISFKYESDIDVNYLVSIFPKNGLCPVFGFVMDWGGNTTEEKDTSPSLDRINPLKGYTKDNVQWISNKANRAKSDQPLDMVVKLGNWAEKVAKNGIKAGRVYR